jgi:xanthine dehydrogenase YagR molybdenum-binding subunit
MPPLSWAPTLKCGAAASAASGRGAWARFAIPPPGIGMALFEETHIDENLARYTNANIAEYLVPVNADIVPIEPILVEEVDQTVNPIGVKGIGEIGIVGVAAAVANAVYHATGKRVRDLPITIEKLF